MMVCLVEESLAQYVSRVRGKVSRDDIAARAKRAGHEISAAYIWKIEDGRSSGPSIDKLRALAAGLGVPLRDVLHVVGLTDSDMGVSKPAGPALAFVNSLGDLTFPPTAEERAILDEADRMGFAFGPLTEPGFWEQPPALRRPLFRDIEGALEEGRRFYQGRGL